MLVNTGDQCKFTVSLIIIITVYNCASTYFICALLHRTWPSCSAALYVGASAAVRGVLASAPQPVPTSFWIKLTRGRTFFPVLSRCSLNGIARSNFVPGYLDVKLCFNCTPINITFSCSLVFLSFKWKGRTSVLVGFGFKRHFEK